MQDSGMESLAEELERLVREYHESPDDSSTRDEAWNLIADFTIEHAAFLVAMLKTGVRL